jgi:hypothetical protein
MNDIINPAIPGSSIPNQTPDPIGVPPHFHKDYRIEEKDLIPNGDHVSVVPDWAAPEGTKVYYLNGSDFRIYTMLDGTWQALQAQTPLDFFSQFVDIVHWNSIDGFTQGGTGGSVNPNDGVLTISSNTTINSTQYINSKDNYHNICETGKLLTVEWQLSDLSHVDTYEIYLHFTNSTAFPPSLTTHHFGFTLLGSGTGVFATVGDGTTESKVDITSFIPGGFLAAAFQRTRLKAVCNRGTDVKFYVNDVLAATITTNLPDTDSLGHNVGIKTLSGVQRYFSLNRILIQKEY